MSNSLLDFQKNVITQHLASDIMLEFSRNDVCVEPIRARRPTKMNQIAGGTRRSGSTGPILRTIQSLRKLLLNSEVGKQLITLTFQVTLAPQSDKDLKKLLSRFTERARRSGTRGIWILEFTEKGIPHIHVVSPNEHVDRDRILAIGQSVSKQCEDCVHIQPIYENDGLEAYLGKLRTKCCPESFGVVGRWYGTFGGIILRVVEFAVTATLSAVAPVLRIMERISGQRISRSFRQTLWAFDRAPGRLECIRRYVSSLGGAIAVSGA